MKQFLILAALVFCHLPSFGQSKHELIKTNLKKLDVFIGEWNISTENFSHSGKRSEEKGIYNFSWALDSTYITRHGSLTNTASNRTRQFVSWLTFDTKVNQFRFIFFYDKRSNMITEYGTYDEQGQTFTTLTSFEIENGVTEYIRHVVDFKNPNEIVGRSWIRLDDAEEANNFKEVLSRF